MHSPDLTQANIAHILNLFPGCVTETTAEDGSVKRAVDFDLLRQELSDALVDGQQERYQLNWPGKRKALLTANAPIAKTLRPARTCIKGHGEVADESVNFNSTKNLYIEGDNLDALKLLQETYLGKVKMIYIDPPYNTGNDFIYEDDFSEDIETYKRRSNQVDDAGNRLTANSPTNGRFHSDWLSMIYARLKLARNLLTDDGVVFVSIDENEAANLRRLCDEIFGEANFVAQLTVIVKPEGRRYGFFAKTHDYVIAYCKNHEKASLNEILVEGLEHPHSDELGGFTLKGLRNRNVQAFNSTNRPNLRYPFYVDTRHPDANGFFSVSTIPLAGHVKVEASTIDGLHSVWRWGKEKAEKQRNDLLAYQGNDGEIRIFQKERKLSQMAKTVLADKEFISNKGTKELQNLLGKGIFDFPKPVALVKLMTTIGAHEDSIVLDFFSGSATTAHAVMQLNAEDGGSRRFIVVQVPELTPDGSEAAKAGYRSIADIGKERIRRAGAIIAKQNPGVDVGFRVLKVDTSNMADVFYTPDALDKNTLDLFVDNIKPDRSPEDLLFQVMLDCGVDLALPIAEDSIQGKKVFFVEGNALLACFDAHGGIDESFVKALAKHQPLRVVFRDAGFKDSAVKINIEQIFKSLSPSTDVKCI